MVSCRIHGVKNLTAQGKRREREGADARREERKEVIVSSGSTVPPGPILLTPGRATRAQRYLLCSTHSVKNTLCSDQSLKDYVVHAQQLRKWSPQLSVCVPISISICVSDPLSLSSSLSLYPLFRPPPPGRAVSLFHSTSSGLVRRPRLFQSVFLPLGGGGEGSTVERTPRRPRTTDSALHTGSSLY